NSASRTSASTSTAARSRSDIPTAPAARAWSGMRCSGAGAAASNTWWSPCASAAARAPRACSRWPEPLAVRLLSRQDLSFQLHDWLGVEALLRAPRFAAHSRETLEAVIDGCERLAVEVLAPCARLGDREEPVFDGERVSVPDAIAGAVRAFADSGLVAATQDEAVGGMQLPVTVEKAALAWLYAANIGACAYPALSIGNASLLLAHGTPAQVEAFALPQLRGEWTGTMCLSEPQAGSSLSDITTRAEYECDSPFGPQYRISGRKMWISGGEHEILGNIV